MNCPGQVGLESSLDGEGLDYHVLSGWWGLNIGSLVTRQSHVSFHAVLTLTCLVSISF